MIPGLKPETRALLVQLLGPKVEEALRRLAEAPTESGLIVTNLGEIFIFPVEYGTFLATPCQWAVYTPRHFHKPDFVSILGPVRSPKTEGLEREVSQQWAVLSTGTRNAWDIFAQIIATGDYITTQTKKFGTCLVFKPTEGERLDVNVGELRARAMTAVTSVTSSTADTSIRWLRNDL